MNSNKQKPSSDLILMYPEGIKKKNKVILPQRRLCVCGNFKKAFLVAFFPFRFEKEKQVRGL